MNEILSAALTALAVGAGGAAGGALIAFLIKKPGRRLSAELMGFSGGIIITAIFEMLHESLEASGIWPVAVGAALGALALFLLTRFIPHTDPADYDDDVIGGIRGTGVGGEIYCVRASCWRLA
jgi:hypothetical protein